MTQVAPYVVTYTSHTPYLTVAEWRAAPTAIDASEFIQGGTQAEQDLVIQDMIERASSWIDDICQQVLAASVDTQVARYRVDRYGYVRVPLPAKPVLEVTAVFVGAAPSTLLPLTSLKDVEISMHGVASIPVPFAPSGRPLVSVTFVNGFPNTTLVSAATATGTSVVLDYPVGVYAGSALTIYDAATGGTENIVVGSGYTSGPTIPLVSALKYDHAAGVSVSNLPARVKQAAVLLTSALIQTRGSDAIVLDSMDTPARTSAAYGANADAERLAKVLLGSLRRTS